MPKYHAGRHFLQIPGPTNVPDRVLRAIENPTIDHRGPDFGVLGTEILANIRTVFGTGGPVVIYPASGTGAWEAALTNTLSPGGISCRSPGRPTCPTGCCARSTIRRWIIAVRNSAASGGSC